MANSRPEKIVNLLSAMIVMVAGLYVIIFMPIALSPAIRFLIGILLTIYFLFRLKLYFRRFKNRDE